MLELIGGIPDSIESAKIDKARTDNTSFPFYVIRKYSTQQSAVRYEGNERRCMLLVVCDRRMTYADE
jgi:hypothetical protein